MHAKMNKFAGVTDLKGLCKQPYKYKHVIICGSKFTGWFVYEMAHEDASTTSEQLRENMSI